MSKRYWYALLGVVILAVVGWGFFFYSGITGKVLFEEPFNSNPSALPDFEPFPDEADVGLSPPESSDEACEDAKTIRRFVCDFYETEYESSCGIFFSGKCNGVATLCQAAQEHVEETCGA